MIDLKLDVGDLTQSVSVVANDITVVGGGKLTARREH